jgi:hypothetical protein
MFTIPVRRLGRPIFGPDGRTIYGTNQIDRDGRTFELGLSKIEFNPTRLSPVPATEGFAIRSFAVSVRQDKLVVSGSRMEDNKRHCGVFEILLPGGIVRDVLSVDCHYQWSWDYLSLSPDGAQAVASVGSNTDGNLRLELIDLVRDHARCLQGFLDRRMVAGWEVDRGEGES